MTYVTISQPVYQCEVCHRAWTGPPIPQPATEADLLVGTETLAHHTEVCTGTITDTAQEVPPELAADQPGS